MFTVQTTAPAKPINATGNTKSTPFSAIYNTLPTMATGTYFAAPIPNFGVNPKAVANVLHNCKVQAKALTGYAFTFAALTNAAGEFTGEIGVWCDKAPAPVAPITPANNAPTEPAVETPTVAKTGGKGSK